MFVPSSFKSENNNVLDIYQDFFNKYIREGAKDNLNDESKKIFNQLINLESLIPKDIDITSLNKNIIDILVLFRLLHLYLFYMLSLSFPSYFNVFTKILIPLDNPTTSIYEETLKNFNSIYKLFICQNNNNNQNIDCNNLFEINLELNTVAKKKYYKCLNENKNSEFILYLSYGFWIIHNIIIRISNN